VALCLARAQLDDLVEHAQAARPEECCGLLGGRAGVVERVYRVRNAEAPERRPVAYRLDAQEQYVVMRELERDGLELVGVYHSHPHSPAYPSETDRRMAAEAGLHLFDGLHHIIVSLQGDQPRVRAFRLKADEVEEVEVVAE
jgi:[CysO sulfur-carrier protein]-S-L-cysteine hydrolase